ncbi:MAG: glycosyltransferase family 1 protein [Roseiflexaceae bacterium]|nr:glycosyltransferase family 1 protein [Roseiflexaceae bacterium]
MRVAIDARLNAYRIGGIPQYTRRLTEALAAIAPETTILTLQHYEQHAPLVTAPNVKRLACFTPPHHRWERFALPIELLRARADVAHFPDFIAPTLRPCRAITTIHDLAFLHFPEILDDAARTFYGRVRESVQHSDAVIAVSEATRRDIVERLQVAPETIDVVYEAAGPAFAPLEVPAHEIRMFGNEQISAGSFALFVSTIEPRKNLATLLRALRICRDRQPDRNYRLVVVGARGWRDEGIFATLQELRLADAIQFVGKVSDSELCWLYNACRMYINPSLYEGFGLPLLEAMACGAACIASQTSSLPEIGGNAAIYIPPLAVEQWADSIVALWEDADRRAELGRLGSTRARQFSWERAARETIAIYRRVCNQ